MRTSTKGEEGECSKTIGAYRNRSVGVKRNERVSQNDKNGRKNENGIGNIPTPFLMCCFQALWFELHICVFV